MRAVAGFIVLWLLAFNAWGLQAEGAPSQRSSHYISDDLFIFVHSGPGTQYRILGSVEAGTPVTRTESAQSNNYVEIVEPDGRTGWIEARYLTESVSRKVLLPELREQLAESQAPLAALQQQVRQLNAQVQQEQTEKNALQQQLDTANQSVARLQEAADNSQQDMQIRWLINGGALALGSIILGILLTYLPKKRKRSDSWMN